MAIRFCKGDLKKLNLKNSLLFDENVFENAHSIFIKKKIDYIPLVDKKNNYICCCYDDHNMDDLFKKINILFNSKYGINKLRKKYHKATIFSLNEISYYLYNNLINLGCKINVSGDLWKYLKVKSIDTSINVGIYSEGNIGLPLKYLGYWKTTFPFNEYDFFVKIYDKGLKNNLLYDKKIISMKKCNNILSKVIKSNKPFMAARLGNTESLITNESFYYYTELWLKYLYTTSGFYSKKTFSNDVFKMFDKKDVDLYSKMTIEAINNCDICLCNFNSEIPLVNKYGKNSINVNWYDLYTKMNNYTWINALKGKKVLIISSFNYSIKKQLTKKDKLFDKYILPDLNLIYYDSPTTYLGNYDSKTSFFDNYKKIVRDINKIDYDIALIAAGAYGYLLASSIKNSGKQAIELCSGLYPIFGIKTKTQSIIRNVSCMYNKYWIFPVEEKPKNYMNLEKGSYWD